MLPAMLTGVYREAMGWIMSLNPFTMLFLFIALLTGSLFSDVRMTDLEVTLPCPNQNKPVKYDQTCQRQTEQTEEGRIKELYSAARVLDSEFESGWTKGLVHHLKVLSTREFSTQPRPLTCDNCNRMDFPAVVMPRDLCGGDRRIDLLVQITTVPQEVEGRRVIRQTWGSLSRNNTASMSYVFLFGTGWSTEEQSIIEEEHKEFNDILQHDYRDSYYNLTYKVVMGFTWAKDHCPDALFILRTATDNFINIPALTRYLREHSGQYQRTQIGRVATLMPVPTIRHRTNKFYVPKLEYPHDHYPPYAIGSAFVYSMEAVAEILVAAPQVPHFALEDCWFGMLMEKINMIPTDFDGFDVVPDMGTLERILHGVCPRDGNFFAVHIPESYTIGDRLVQPHEFVSQLWGACARFNMAAAII